MVFRTELCLPVPVEKNAACRFDFTKIVKKSGAVWISGYKQDTIRYNGNTPCFAAVRISSQKPGSSGVRWRKCGPVRHICLASCYGLMFEWEFLTFWRNSVYQTLQIIWGLLILDILDILSCPVPGNLKFNF